MEYRRRSSGLFAPSPPATFVGEGIGANNTLICPVHLDVTVSDFAVSNVIDDFNGTAAVDPPADFVIEEHQSNLMLGQGCDFVDDSSYEFVWSGTTSFRRLQSLSFRGIEAGPTYSDSGGGTSTSASIPALTIDNPGSTVVIVILINAASQTLTPSGFSPSLIPATQGSSTVTSRLYYVLDVDSFSGGSIGWSTSAAFIWCASVYK